MLRRGLYRLRRFNSNNTYEKSHNKNYESRKKFVDKSRGLSEYWVQRGKNETVSHQYASFRSSRSKYPFIFASLAINESLTKNWICCFRLMISPGNSPPYSPSMLMSI